MVLSKILIDIIIEKLESLDDSDPENSHSIADELLIELLRIFLLKDDFARVQEAFTSLEKFYA